MHLEDLEAIAQEHQEADAALAHVLYVCTGTGLSIQPQREVLKALQAEVAAADCEKKCAVRPGGCQGCSAAAIGEFQIAGSAFISA